LARKEDRSLEKHADELLLDEQLEEDEHQKNKEKARKQREKEKEDKEAAEAEKAKSTDISKIPEKYQ
jgi:hypothetical protein